MAADGTSGTSTGKAGRPTNASKLKEYEQALEAGELKFGTAVDNLLLLYLGIMSQASRSFTKETDRAVKAYNAIANPAQNDYDRSMKRAEHVFKHIMDPATKMLTDATDAANNLYNDGIAPLDNAFQNMISDASNILGTLDPNASL